MNDLADFATAHRLLTGVSPHSQLTGAPTGLSSTAAGSLACALAAAAVLLLLLWRGPLAPAGRSPREHGGPPPSRPRAALHWLPAAAAAALLGLALFLLAPWGRFGRASQPAPTTVLREGPLDQPTDVVVTTSAAFGDARATPRTVTHTHSIFVSVASYRDYECAPTLRALFAAATTPQRVFVGAVDQLRWRNESCLLGLEPRWGAHVRVKTIDYLESRGPTWGRYLAAQLYRGERYYMQLDSHSRFRPRWDSGLIAMLGRTGAPKPVLTVYPEGYPFDPHTERLSVLCGGDWASNGLVAPQTQWGPRVWARPLPVPFIAAGFLFGPGTLVTEVPFDGQLPDLFVGEEILYAARLWTSGYDFFSPDANLVFHLYVNDQNKQARARPKYWEDSPEWYRRQVESEQKVKAVLGLWDQQQQPGNRSAGPQWGLGQQRSLEAYWAYANVDIQAANRTGHTGAYDKFCPGWD